MFGIPTVLQEKMKFSKNYLFIVLKVIIFVICLILFLVLVSISFRNKLISKSWTISEINKILFHI